ncbi:MAG: (2Fe-2S)-binding protein [Pseudomonadota bacterium]
MIICSCNIIREEEVRAVITDLLRDDPWQLIVPVQVYHEMGKRGKCCGCFPRLVDVIVGTTEAFHRDMHSEEAQIIEFIGKLREKHQQCETARMLARARMQKSAAA